VVEPSMTVTGSNADHRLRLKGSAIGHYLKALAAELVAQGVPVGTSIGSAVQGAKVEGVPEQWIKVVAKELAANRRESLVVAGSRQPAAVHALVFAINRALANPGKTVSYSPAPDQTAQRCFADIKALAGDMAAGKVDTLIMLGGNPVHDAPADVAFADALKKVNISIAVSDRADETADLASWHAPRANPLEAWGDLLSRSGHYTVLQPLIAPLHGARSDIEILATLAGESETSGLAHVRETAKAHGAGDTLAFDRLVQKGVSESGASQTFTGLAVNETNIVQALGQLPPASAGLEAVFLADNKVWDGDQVNNTWLLEIPDPITRITWDNAALIGPSTAKQLGVSNGDMIKVSVGGASAEIVAWVQPGQADGVVGLPLGWGRAKAGQNAVGAGFDVYPLRTTAAPHYAEVQVEKLGRSYPLSQTQEHDFMEGRPLAVDATLAEYREKPEFGQWATPDFSAGPLWETQDYSQGHQWAMVIDLNNCTGCGACVAACQAENNIPVVGKDQVARGREMSWMRIDRYYVGEDEDNPEVAFQPVACQQCEEAPCENVCPVNATSHSPEGLNDIAYNRCIGTRYCMNNCPYKVRRFNFLNFNLDIPETEQMQKNPEVTIRFRGVIEKCTYCVQRIQKAKIGAKAAGRTLADGDITTACQQVCPAQAITFGDKNDPKSAVSQKRDVDREYGLLADVGTRPRTRFLGKIRNPNPEMKG
jgi:molybdopterin-containing oxidoreductase family iron-sulfur binding subunit